MNSAQARRELELNQLVSEGVPLRTLGKSGHWIIGPLHIYTATGRWFCEQTGRHGRLNGQRMRRILECEYYHVTLHREAVEHTKPKPMEGVLSPEAIERTRRLQIRYQLAPAKQKSERLRPVTRATAATPHTNNTSEASSRTRVARKPAVPPASQCRKPVSCPRTRGDNNLLGKQRKSVIVRVKQRRLSRR
jgi:hypothetical protein